MVTIASFFIPGNCTVVPTRCEFPFDYNGENFFRCIQLESSLPEYGDPDSIDKDWYCRVDVGGMEAWGKCNESCLDDEGKSKNEFQTLNLLNILNINERP